MTESFRFVFEDAQSTTSKRVRKPTDKMISAETDDLADLLEASSGSASKPSRRGSNPKPFKQRSDIAKQTRANNKETFRDIELQYRQLLQENRNLKALAAKLGVPVDKPEIEDPGPQSETAPSHPGFISTSVPLMEQMNLAFCILDVSELNFKIQYASPEFCKLSGYQAASLVNLSYRDLPCSPMVNLSKYRKLEAALKNRRDDSVEIVHQLLDGRQFYSIVYITHHAAYPLARPFVIALYSPNSVSPMCTPDVPYRTMLTTQLSLGALSVDKASPRMFPGAPARIKRLSLLDIEDNGVVRSASADQLSAARAHRISPKASLTRSPGIISHRSPVHGVSRSVSGPISLNATVGASTLAQFPRTNRAAILRGLSATATLSAHSLQSAEHNTPSLVVFEESPRVRLQPGASASSLSTSLTRNSSFCSTASASTDLIVNDPLCADFTRSAMVSRVDTFDDASIEARTSLSPATTAATLSSSSNSADLHFPASAGTMHGEGNKDKPQAKRKAKHSHPRTPRARSTSEVQEPSGSTDIIDDAQSVAAPRGSKVHPFAPPYPVAAGTTAGVWGSELTTQAHLAAPPSATPAEEIDEISNDAFEFLANLFD